MSRSFYALLFSVCALILIWMSLSNKDTLQIWFLQSYYDLGLSEPIFRKDGHLSIWRNNNSLVQFQIEIADSEVSRSMGLMFRRSLKNDQAMIFIFKEAQPRAFWMKNTYIPLDITFIGADSTILNIEHSDGIFSTRQVLSRGAAQFVLEMNFGLADSLGIERGNKLRW